MDSAAQAAGEKRVREKLIDRLLALGLIRPAGMKVDQFDAMLAELCSKLAYMSEGNLAGLAEIAAGMASGKSQDRFPIAAKVLARAVELQAPPDDASPLIRSVFAHELGREAIRQGWAPELLRQVRRVRLFPKDYVVSQVMADARDSVQRMRSLEARIEGGGDLTPEETTWRAARMAALRKCQEIADLSGQKEAAE